MKELGYLESEFEVKQMEQQPTTVEPSPKAGVLTVTRKETALSKVYLVGFGSSWLGDFADDLTRGAFGRRHQGGK